MLLKKLASEGAAILMAARLFGSRNLHSHRILKQGSLVKELDPGEVTSNELESIYLNFMQS